MLNLLLKTAMFRRIGAPVSKQAIWQAVLRAGGGAARSVGQTPKGRAEGATGRSGEGSSRGLGGAPSNANPDLKTDGIRDGVSSGVKGSASTAGKVQPQGARVPTAKDIAGGKTLDAKPDLKPDALKGPKK